MDAKMASTVLTKKFLNVSMKCKEICDLTHVSDFDLEAKVYGQ